MNSSEFDTVRSAAYTLSGQSNANIFETLAPYQSEVNLMVVFIIALLFALLVIGID